MSTFESQCQWLAQHRSLSPRERWKEIRSQAVVGGLGFQQCHQLWERAFSDWPLHTGPRPMWFPDESTIGNSNIAAFCQAYDLEDFVALHQWSVADPAAFWQAMARQLKMVFRKSPDTWLDQSRGVAEARWCVSGTLNIVESCLPIPAPGTTDSNDTSGAARRALIWGGPDRDLQSMTYAQLLDHVRRCAAALRACGLAEKSIAVFMPMTPASVVFYLAIVWTGGRVVSIADSFSPPEIAKRMKIANAQCVVTYDRISRNHKPIELLERVHQAGNWQTIVLREHQGFDQSDVAVSASEPPHRTFSSQLDMSFADFINQAPLNAAEAETATICRADDVINILFSSGTTGEPKAIPWTHQTPLKCAADAWIHHDIHAGDVIAWPTNLGWMMGPWLIFAGLINRASIALYQDAPTTAPFGQFVQQAGVTMLGLVPSIVKHWRASGCMEKAAGDQTGALPVTKQDAESLSPRYDWSGVRVFSSTGESSHAEDYLYLSWLAGFKPIIEYCGGTEIGGGYITSTVTVPNCPATFSTAAIGLDFEILSADGKAASAGELFLIPPSIGLSQTLLNRDHFETYFADAPLSPSGRMLRRHGDHFKRLPGGYYAAGGRVDDTMNLGGIKVSSIELEAVINQIPGVAESAAIAVSGDGGPDALVVFVVATQAPATDIAAESVVFPAEEQPALQCINRHLKDRLNPLFRCTRVVRLASLPRTASNKIMRRVLRDTL